MIVSVFRHVRTPGSNGEEQTEMAGGCGPGRTGAYQEEGVHFKMRLTKVGQLRYVQISKGILGQMAKIWT